MTARRDGSKNDVSVVISVDDSFVENEEIRHEVIAAIEQAGLAVVKVMPRIGVVTGRVRSGDVAKLKKVAHVVSVEFDERRSMSAR